MSRALAAPAAMSWVTKLDLRSFAVCSAVSIAASSTTPSCTRRCGSPPSPERTDGHATLEASGGLTLERARDVAETGVDYISVGALTHSAVVFDLGMDLRES